MLKNYFLYFFNIDCAIVFILASIEGFTSIANKLAIFFIKTTKK